MARLARIVVKEVSLVDKAANKRKFLFAKRQDDKEAESTPEEILKIAGETFDALMGLLKGVGKGEGNRSELPDYAQQAKAFLQGKIEEAISFFTSEERTQLAKKLSQDPAGSASGTEAEGELSFSSEELEVLAKIGPELDKLQTVVKELSS